MRYMQIKYSDEEEFIKVKKAALDARLSLEDFIKTAVQEKLNSIYTEESIPQSSTTNKEK